MKKLLLGIFTFLYVICAKAQEVNLDNTKASLENIITAIEKNTTVYFSYNEAIIKNRNVELEKQQWDLNYLLIELEHQTGLHFKKVSNTQVSISFRQRICGKVIDAVTQSPLAFAEIILGNKGTVTNENGSFEFETSNKTPQQIQIIYTGYKTEDITLNVGEACQTIPLTLNPESLGEVIVTGYVTSGIDRNKDGSLEINSEKLGILPGLVTPDIAQSLQLVPGVVALDESATGIQFRGGSSDQNLVLYDNIKLYNLGYFFGQFSLFNPFATDNARIFRSGTGANYGDRISGIIDVSSKDEIPVNTGGGFEIDGITANAFVETPLSKKAGLSVYARRSYGDLWRTPTYDGYAEKIFRNFGVARDINGNVLELETDDDFDSKSSDHEYVFGDINAKFVYNPNDKNHIEFSSLYTKATMDFEFSDGGETKIDNLSTENFGVSFKWEHQHSEKSAQEISSYYSKYNSFYENLELEDEIVEQPGLELSEINVRENDISDFGFNFTQHFNFDQKHQLGVGYELANIDLKVVNDKVEPFDPADNESVPQNIHTLNNAVFANYTYNYGKNSIVNAGLRLVHYGSLSETFVEPRVNFEHEIIPELRFKAAAEIRNQSISQQIEFNQTEFRLENNLWRLADDDTYPLLSSKQVSGGFLVQLNRWNFDIDTYYRELDGITTFTSGFSNPIEDLTPGESTIKGVDVLAKYKYKDYQAWVGYSHNDIELRFPSLNADQQKFPGNNDVTHNFRISNTYKLNNWQFSLGWQYRSGKPFTPVNSFEIKIDADGENAGVTRFGTTNSDRLPDYHRLDASILYDFNLGKKENDTKAQVGISFLNIYNRQRPIDIIYRAELKPLDDGGIAKPGTTGATPEDRELIVEQVIQRFSLGFTPNAVFRLRF